MNRTGNPQNSYIGRYYHALEQKGRLSIPVSFRSIFNDGAILTRGLDGCLFLFATSTWEAILHQQGALSFTKKAHRDWIRLLTNNANHIFPDALGRILIPSDLRETARLHKQVVIVGSLDRLEIWDSEVYRDYSRALEAEAESIAEGVTNVA